MAMKVPGVGHWFWDPISQQLFEVVAIDEHSSSIGVQFVDGELGEFEFEMWASMALEPAAPPEDWAASYELAFNDPENSGFASNFDDPLVTIESDITLGIEDI